MIKLTMNKKMTRTMMTRKTTIKMMVTRKMKEIKN